MRYPPDSFSRSGLRLTNTSVSISVPGIISTETRISCRACQIRCWWPATVLFHSNREWSGELAGRADSTTISGCRSPPCFFAMRFNSTITFLFFIPAIPIHAYPRRATPSRAGPCRARPSPAAPGLALPAVPCQAPPRRARPRRAAPAVPYSGFTILNVPQPMPPEFFESGRPSQIPTCSPARASRFATS